MLAEYLNNVRTKTPLVHNITNYVTVNDCANILLACGASPIMADDIEEVANIIAICHSLNINIGTLNQRTVPAMFRAAKEANTLGRPALLDPVGAGASALRGHTAMELLQQARFAVLRGNVSEIKALAHGVSSARGVDADALDALHEHNIDAAVALARDTARRFRTVTAMTGAIDIISDGERAAIVRNGSHLMNRITGAGCMLSAMTAAYIGADPEHIFEATLTSLCAMSLAAEQAERRMQPMDGNASFRNHLIDAICNMDGETLERGANYELR